MSTGGTAEGGSTSDEGRPLTRARLVELARHLSARDADLAGVLVSCGPPPLWSRPAGFGTLVRIILEQQVSLASARAMYERAVARLGEITPRRLARAGEGRLRAIGFTRQKAAYCCAAARAIEQGDLDLDRLRRAGDDEARGALRRLKGIGPWSADIYLLMALRRPDIWPAGDLAIVAALRRLKRVRGSLPTRRVEAMADDWRPYRSVAARMLWQYYLAERRAS